MLQQSLESHVEKCGVKNAFQLGVCMNLPSTHAVRGHGLVALKSLILGLLDAVPSGFILYSVGGLGFGRVGSSSWQGPCFNAAAGLMAERGAQHMVGKHVLFELRI